MGVIGQLSRKHPEQAHQVFRMCLQNNAVTDDEFSLAMMGKFESEDRARVILLSLKQTIENLRQMNGERGFKKPKCRYDPRGGPAVNTNNPGYNERYADRPMFLRDTREDKQEKKKAMKAGWWR